MDKELLNGSLKEEKERGGFMGKWRKPKPSAESIQISEKPSEPCVVQVNPYLSSPKNALELMAKICSAKCSSYDDAWSKAGDILQKTKYTELIVDNRDIFLNSKFEYEFGEYLLSLIWAMSNETLGNRPRVIVGIVGHFNAGKSTLLNYLVGQGSLLPTNPIPTTVVPAYLYCRNDKDITENHFFGVNQNNALMQLDEFAISGIEQSSSDKEDDAYVENDTHVSVSAQIATALSRFIIEVPHEQFNNILFIDTPGYSNKDSDNSTADDCLQQADMVMYLVDCMRGNIGRDDLERIDKINVPIMLIITRNSLITLPSDVNKIYERIKSQVASNSLVKDVICLGFDIKNDPIKLGEIYYSRSGLSLGESLQRIAKESNCITDIDKYWGKITNLFKKEIKNFKSQQDELEKEKERIQSKQLDLRSEVKDFLYYKDKYFLSHYSYSTEVINYLLDYYVKYFDERRSEYREQINIIDQKINRIQVVIDGLQNIHQKLSEWKLNASRQLTSLEYKKEDRERKKPSPFDAVADLTDVGLKKFIDSLRDGYDVTTKYNDDGFSVLTYTAYCGNIPALLFLLSKIKYDRKAFFIDREKRNIMHAAAEGLQLNVLNLLKEKFPKFMSKEDANGKTCDEIVLSKFESRKDANGKTCDEIVSSENMSRK